MLVLLEEAVTRKFNYAIVKNQGLIDLRSFINPSTNHFQKILDLGH